MATRSTIGLLKEDGKIQSIYCHWDGYPEYVGKMLMEHYTDPNKAQKLINLGYISSLEQEVEIPEGTEHSFAKRQDGITIAYHRDRGEEHFINEDANEKAYFDYGNKDWEEYRYLGKVNVDGTISWFVKSIHTKTDDPIELTQDKFDTNVFDKF